MRGQPAPCLVPGNSLAARRFARARKPPPIILWSIGIITCLLFAGAAALLAVGYLNPFGTVGLSILGVGAVVYFGAIIFLVLSCLWVERKYPGMQPLSFKFYSRKPQRPTPTAFVNPNISGQTPQTIPSYRIHNETPSDATSVDDTEEITENFPSGPRDSTQNKNDKQNGNDLPKQVSSLDHDNTSATQQSLHDEGSGDNIKELEDITINETSNSVGDTSAITSENRAIKDISNAQNENAIANTSVQNENISQNNQKEVKSSDAQKEGKTQQKIHQQELPVEDYPSPEKSNRGTSNIKEFGPETQRSKPKRNAQQRRKSLEISPSHSAVASSISTSQEERTTMHQHKETYTNEVPGLSSTKEQHSTEKQLSFDQQTQQNTAQTVNTETDGLFKKNQNVKNVSQTDNLQRQHAVRVRKQTKESQSKNIPDISEVKMIGLTDSALLADARKPILHNKQDTVLQPPNSGKKIDSAMLKKTSVNERKRVQFQEYVQSAQPSADANNALKNKNDGRHGHQNELLTKDVSASAKHLAQNPDFQGALPGFPKKVEKTKKPKMVESPERVGKQESPGIARKQESPGIARKQESPGITRTHELPGITRKQESPGITRKQESPGIARTHELPGITRKQESPGITRKQKSPGITRTHELPGVTRQQESPGKARKQESPERARKQESPERARKQESPERARKQESPERARKQESPERGRKPESPERGRKLRTDYKLSHSPPNVRTIVPSSSPTRHHQNISSKAQINKDNPIAMTSLSSSKEELYRRQNYHSSPSSQSSVHPSSTSPSPPRHHKRSPDPSQKLSKHHFHASGNAEFFSSARKEKKRDIHSEQSSPSSYSSDVTSSTSSSPQRHRQRDSDISNKGQTNR
ncbi:uncharacterized protein ACMZJ9_007041 [Mantella aurantiaca]